jgi:tetratricopeptide (TPR) repeat protein
MPPTLLARAAMVLIAVLAASSAHAEDSFVKPTNAEARAHLAAGNRHYRLREFDKAVEEYKAGALKEDVPVFYYNLGQCYRQLGRPEDAIWHYQRFLDRGQPTGQVKDAVDGFIKELKDDLMTKALKPKPPEPKPPVPTPPPSTVTVVDRAEPWYRDGFAWGLTGTGVVASGVALGFVIDAHGLDKDANSETRQEASRDLHARASERRLVGGIIGIVGGAALITGVVKLIIHPTDRVRTVKTPLSFGVVPGGVLVMGRF